MRNETRLVYNGMLGHIAKLNGVPNAAESFSVTPSVQQKLETAVQESSDFLKRINTRATSSPGCARVRVAPPSAA